MYANVIPFPAAEFSRSAPSAAACFREEGGGGPGVLAGRGCVLTARGLLEEGSWNWSAALRQILFSIDLVRFEENQPLISVSNCKKKKTFSLRRLHDS